LAPYPLGRLLFFAPKVVGDGRRQSDTKGSNSIITITSLKLGQMGGKTNYLLNFKKKKKQHGLITKEKTNLREKYLKI
jgi:hypothetical protein